MAVSHFFISSFVLVIAFLAASSSSVEVEVFPELHEDAENVCVELKEVLEEKTVHTLVAGTVVVLRFNVTRNATVVSCCPSWAQGLGSHGCQVSLATTAAPTTAEPTTAVPTTAVPTTAEPTTAEPTTAAPTTAEPSRVALTTAAPSTAEPTKSTTQGATTTEGAINRKDNDGGDDNEEDIILGVSIASGVLLLLIAVMIAYFVVKQSRKAAPEHKMSLSAAEQV